MDMIAGETEREQIAQELAGGEKVWWMTPGWMEYRHQVFEGWDKGIANENFPKHTGGAVVLDGIGYVDKYMARKAGGVPGILRLDGDPHTGLPRLPGPVQISSPGPGQDPGKLNKKRPFQMLNRKRNGTNPKTLVGSSK